MNVLSLTRLIAALIVVVSNSAHSHGAHVSDPNDSAPVSVFYTNAAYTRAISGSPNPVPDVPAVTNHGTYVNQAFGPAIHSYPSTTGSAVSR